MDDATTWRLIHAERGAAADLFEGLTPEQWTHDSLCRGWSVRDVAGHILMAAEQTPGRFVKGFVTSGYRFNVMTRRDVASLGALAPGELVARLRARTTTTNKPPAPALAMLGEIVVHTADIRRPLGLAGAPAPEAVAAILPSYTRASFPVGGKKLVPGLRLVATDVDFSSGSGPEVRGPGLSLALALTGRPVGLDGLEGDGLATLRSRLAG